MTNDASGTSSARRVAAIVLGLSFSVFFAVLAFRDVEIYAVVDGVGRASVWVLLASLVPRAVGVMLVALRTRLMIPADSQPPFREVVWSVIVGVTGNSLLPLRLGELLRVDYLARKSQNSRAAFAAIVGVERLWDALVLLVLFAVSLVLLLGRASVPMGASVLAGGLVLAFTIVIWVSRDPRGLARLVRRFGRWFGETATGWLVKISDDFSDALAPLRNARTVLQVFGVTCAYWATWVLGAALWLAAFGFELPWYSAILVLTFATFGTMIPSSPGHVGTFHYFAAFALLELGASPADAAAFALVAHVVAVFPVVTIGIIGLFVLWISGSPGQGFLGKGWTER